MTEEEQPADLAELLEELDENNRLVVFRLLKRKLPPKPLPICPTKPGTIW